MAVDDPHWSHIEKLTEIPPHLLREIEHFFASYKTLEKKNVHVEGWRNKEAALQTIKEAQERYKQKGKKKKKKTSRKSDWL